jgi:hypothetical protein
VTKERGVWTSEQCETVISEVDSNGVTCKCKSLSPTTVLNDLKDLLGNSKLNDVFSSKGLNSFLEMKYWEYPVFYILALKTIVYVYFLFKGY